MKWMSIFLNAIMLAETWNCILWGAIFKLFHKSVNNTYKKAIYGYDMKGNEWGSGLKGILSTSNFRVCKHTLIPFTWFEVSSNFFSICCFKSILFLRETCLNTPLLFFLYQFMQWCMSLAIASTSELLVYAASNNVCFLANLRWKKKNLSFSCYQFHLSGYLKINLSNCCTSLSLSKMLTWLKPTTFAATQQGIAIVIKHLSCIIRLITSMMTWVFLTISSWYLFITVETWFSLSFAFTSFYITTLWLPIFSPFFIMLNMLWTEDADSR